MQSISLSEIDSYLVDVSEEISAKHLQEFLFYQLSQKAITLDVSSKVFYVYLQESQKYFIAHFKTSEETYVIDPYILKAYYLNQKTSNTQVDLFICKDYFALYKNQKLLFFKSTLQKVSNLEV